MANRFGTMIGVAESVRECYHEIYDTRSRVTGEHIMEHGKTSDPRRIALSLLEFSRRAAQRSLMVLRTSVSNTVPIPHAEFLRVRNPAGDQVVDLIGNGRDAAYVEEDLQPLLQELLATRNTMIEAGPMILMVHGNLSARAPNASTFLLECEHIRENGSRSGSIDRMLLIVDESRGLMLGRE